MPLIGNTRVWTANHTVRTGTKAALGTEKHEQPEYTEWLVVRTTDHNLPCKKARAGIDYCAS